MTEPIFNPETLAGYKVTVSSDVVFRWANAIAGATGSLQGINSALEKNFGRSLKEVADEVAHLEEIRAEIVAEMKGAMGL